MNDREQPIRGERARARGAPGFELGRVLGIRLTVEWSFLFIFFLMTWALVSIFTRWHAEWPFGARLLVALAAALLFVASLVGHELAHAVVARRFDVPVHELRLFLLGGVSDLEREPPSPRAELLIALAGPAVSYAIGLVCLVTVSTFFDPTVSHGPLTTVLLWLGPINVLIGTFNLLPGFPLDGGRVLRAVLWRATGDLEKATRWASGIGQGLGWALVVTGIAVVFGARVPFFGAGTVSGFWLALIGMFLTTAARRSYQLMMLEKMLEGVVVRRLMRTEGDVMSAAAPLSDAADSFLRSREHMFPVVEDEALVGLLSIEDMGAAPRQTWGTTRVAEVMTPFADLVVTTPDEPVTAAMRKLAHHRFEQLPVVDGGRLVGVLEVSAVERWLEMQMLSTRPPHTPKLA